MLKNRILIALGCLFAATLTSEAQISRYSSGGGGFSGGSGGGSGDMIAGAGYLMSMEEAVVDEAKEIGFFGYAGKQMGDKAFWYVQGVSKSASYDIFGTEMSNSEMSFSGVFNYNVVGSNSENFSVYGFAGAGMSMLTQEITYAQAPDSDIKVESEAIILPMGAGVNFAPFSGVKVFAEYDMTYYMAHDVALGGGMGGQAATVEAAGANVGSLKLGVQIGL